MRDSIDSLTEDEGTLLSLIARAQPITAYQIAKVYKESPVSNFGVSKGKIYPMVTRLRKAGLLSAKALGNDRRGTELIGTTEKGLELLRDWLREIRPAHLLPEDPLRTRLQSLSLLTREQRLQWVAELKMQLLQKLADVEQYGRTVTSPYHDLVHDNAIRSIRSRMDWLDLLLNRIVNEADES